MRRLSRSRRRLAPITESLLDSHEDALDRGEDLRLDGRKIRFRSVPVYKEAERHRRLFFAILDNHLSGEALGVEWKLKRRGQLSAFRIGRRVRRHCQRYLHRLRLD